MARHYHAINNSAEYVVYLKKKSKTYLPNENISINKKKHYLLFVSNVHSRVFEAMVFIREWHADVLGQWTGKFCFICILIGNILQRLLLMSVLE